MLTVHQYGQLSRKGVQQYIITASSRATAQLTGILDSLAAAAARLFSTDSRRTPCRCGRSGFGKLGANLAVT